VVLPKNAPLQARGTTSAHPGREAMNVQTSSSVY
jgi:hypothetical protein